MGKKSVKDVHMTLWSFAEMFYPHDWMPFTCDSGVAARACSSVD